MSMTWIKLSNESNRSSNGADRRGAEPQEMGKLNKMKMRRKSICGPSLTVS
jgi:hypothetical protein